MQTNADTITRFYNAFGQLDYSTMNSLYTDDIVFNDPVFGILKGYEAKAMWEMLCKNARDFSLSFSNIQLLDDEYATCDWSASYTFSKTGRRVTNKVHAYMKLKDGFIAEHSDAFKISKWASQALGIKGALFGWTGFMKRKIRDNARQSLINYIHKRESSDAKVAGNSIH